MKTFILKLSFFLVLMSPAVANLQPKEVITPGGIRFWFLQDMDTPVVAMSFTFEGGAKFDPVGKEGLASLSVSILSEGTKDKTSKEVSEFVQDNALSFKFSTETETISGAMTMLKQYKDQGFGLLREVLLHPRLTDETLDKIKADTLTSLANIANDPSYLANLKFNSTLFPGHFYERPTLGTPEAVEGINLEDIKGFLHENLTLDRLTIAITGNLTEAQAKDYVDQAFGHLPAVSDIPNIESKIEPVIEGQYEHIDMDIPQSMIYFALPGIHYDDPDFLKAAILVQIMSGDMSSRLYAEIREKRGLAYGIAAGIVWTKETGYFKGYLGTNFDQAEESIALTKLEWEQLKKGGISEEELKSAQTSMINSYPLRFTNSLAISEILLGYQRFNRSLDYFQKRAEMISAITVEEMNEFINKVMKPDQIVFVIVGRDKEVKNKQPEKYT